MIEVRTSNKPQQQVHVLAIRLAMSENMWNRAQVIVPIAVAIIAMIGTLSAALVANWDKFSPNSVFGSESTLVSPQKAECSANGRCLAT